MDGTTPEHTAVRVSAALDPKVRGVLLKRGEEQELVLRDSPDVSRFLALLTAALGYTPAEIWVSA